VDKTINKIKEIKSTLEGLGNADESRLEFATEIENAIGKKLPREIKCFLVNSSHNLAETTASIFMGYEPIDLESIAKMYRDKKDPSACCFLGSFRELSDNLVLHENESFEIIQNLESEFDDGPQVTDMKNVVPLMDGTGYYIVLLYKFNGETEIAIATEDYCLSSIAPSLKEYLDVLQIGLEKEVFRANYDAEYDELEIEAPEIWREKLAAIA
jgi:hypothetical protein